MDYREIKAEINRLITWAVEVNLANLYPDDNPSCHHAINVDIPWAVNDLAMRLESPRAKFKRWLGFKIKQQTIERWNGTDEIPF